MRLIVLVVLVALASACPEKNGLNEARKQLTDEIGHAPKAQIDDAKERMHRAEDKLDKRAAEAAAIGE